MCSVTHNIKTYVQFSIAVLSSCGMNQTIASTSMVVWLSMHAVDVHIHTL